MNRDVYIIDEHLLCVSHPASCVPDEPAARQRQQVEAHLERVISRLNMLLGHKAAEPGVRSIRQQLLEIGNLYRGSDSRRFGEFCRGLHLMAQMDFRQALPAFEEVLLGQAEREFEPIREIALQAHSQCLEWLGFDDHSLEQFTEFLYQKFEETRENGRPDDVASQLGLGRPVA